MAMPAVVSAREAFSAETSLVLGEAMEIRQSSGGGTGVGPKSYPDRPSIDGVAMDDGSCIPSRRYLRKLGLLQNWHFAGNKVWTR
jgi:hypothetical protein